MALTNTAKNSGTYNNPNFNKISIAYRKSFLVYGTYLYIPEDKRTNLKKQ